jgi:DNA polymerase III alpha subunit (gram-positive type)
MEQRLVFFDLETGGLDPRRNPIIQLAAVAVDAHLEVLEAFEAKIRFDPKKATAHSLRKNHYHPGRWATEARDTKEVAKDFAAFLQRHATVAALSAQGKAYQMAQLVAHNAAFDGPFLQAWFDRQNVYLPAKRLVLCTMQLAMWQVTLSGDKVPSNFQLATLCEHFGVSFHAAAAHEALGDVSATVGLFRAIVRSTTNQGQSVAA